MGIRKRCDRCRPCRRACCIDTALRRRHGRFHVRLPRQSVRLRCTDAERENVGKGTNSVGRDGKSVRLWTYPRHVAGSESASYPLSTRPRGIPPGERPCSTRRSSGSSRSPRAGPPASARRLCRLSPSPTSPSPSLGASQPTASIEGCGSSPNVLVRGSPGAVLELGVRSQAGRKHLPVVLLRRVA